MAFSSLSNSTDAATLNLAPAKPQHLILLVENNLAIRAMLRRALESQGYGVLEAPCAESAVELLLAQPRLTIVDLDLPNIHSDDLLLMLQERNDGIPIVALSIRANESCIVQALDLGADAYLTKPFGLKELFSRIRNLLRRRHAFVDDDRPLLRSGDLSVDLSRRLVKVGERQVKLTPKEYKLLEVLLQNAGKVLTHRFLLGEVWDCSKDVAHLRGYIRQLRQKIEADPEHPCLLVTQAGIGYRMLAPSPQTPTPQLIPQPETGLNSGHFVYRANQLAFNGTRRIIF